MVYDTAERSEQDAAPLELYAFTVYNQVYRFTSASDDQEFALSTWEAQTMDRSSFKVTGELPKNDLTIDARQDHPITAFFSGQPPSTVVLLQIIRVHRGDTDDISFWNGRVLGCRYRGRSAIFQCENIFTSLRRPGLRRLYSRGCPFDLYGAECQVNPLAHRVTATLDAVTGAELQSTALNTDPDIGRYAGGYIEWEQAPGQIVTRGIMAHAGNSIFVSHPVSGLAAGASIFAFPGCKHDIPDCNDTYNNLERYGGLTPYLAGKNPFGGNSVF